MKNLILRSITGIVYIAFIVGGIMMPLPAMWVLVFVLAVGAMCEFHKLTAKLGAFENQPLLVYDTLGVLALALLPAMTQAPKSHIATVVCLLFVLFYVLSRPILSLYNANMKESLVNLSFGIFGLAYVGLPLAAMGWIGLMVGGPWILLGMFILIWLNDTGAFVIGSMIGSRRLFERLSPKKSWEGFVGGLVFCIIGAVVYYYCAKAHLPVGISVVEMGIYGAVVSVVATWGDLFESMLKRAAGVKDSGNILPGHGGVLDRIDSFLFVSPATLLYIALALMI